ncbi:EAP30/Vps36 family-domain-containing protein [Dipodascopsis tothii]|uniref:EAP30/Vps36 family-domain-containing protein n=1 Tax=Dipodascopsis tothii TaxID=44089 RepID=UPI0034CEA04C
MRFWTPIELSAAHRPVLGPDESDVLVQSSVGLYDGRTRMPEHQNGRVYLTSHRICYVDDERPLTHSMAITLSEVRSVQYSAGFLRSSPKVTLNFGDDASGLASFTASPVDSPRGSTIGLAADMNASSKRGSPAIDAAPVTWICPICSFSNTLPLSYVHDSSPIPPCKTCGIKPAADVLRTACDAAAATAVAAAPREVKENGAECPRCTFVNHPLLKVCEICGARLTTFVTADYRAGASPRAESFFPFAGSSSPRPAADYGPEELPYVKLSFRAGGDRALYDRVKTMLVERSWLKNQAHTRRPISAAALHAPAAAPEPPARKGPNRGIHGLQQLNERVREQNKDLMTSLDDLSSLMTKAKDMIALAESFALRLQGAPGVPEAARKALQDSSRALALSSPIVTKEIAGGGDELYFSELARQLAEFLDSGVLRAEGGIVTLFDLFALYNRARGISLISPQDLHSACLAFDSLRLPFRLRQFRSGVMVVQAASRHDDAIVRDLVAWIRSLGSGDFASPGVSAQEATQRFGWSVGVSAEELDAAVDAGALCRDTIVEGSRYHLNLITSYTWAGPDGAVPERDPGLPLDRLVLA